MLQEKSLGSVKILSVDYDLFIKSIKDAAAEIKRSHNHVKKVLLFGSFVTHRYTPESDVDLMIVVESDQTPFIQRSDPYLDFFEHIPFDVNVLVYTQEEIESMLEQKNLFLTSVLSEAREL